jgi:hypothetical protein
MYPAHSVCRCARHTTRKRVPRAGYMGKKEALT